MWFHHTAFCDDILVSVFCKPVSSIPTCSLFLCSEEHPYIAFFFFKFLSLYYIVYNPDINECDDNNGGCSQICTNTEGSYECSCTNGYVLNSDRHNCSGI